MKERPIGIDLFAGAGGMSLGFEQAGFDVAAAVEIDPIHAAVHHYNFPRTSVLARSVAGLSGKRLRELSGLGTKPVSVVFGGPPCQGFSLIGHRMLDDDRNRLVREFVRVVAELEAKYFVFENVKGLTIGNHRMFLEILIRECGAAGYQVALPWRVLNAANYGVPQDRQRLFLLGCRKGLTVPDYPAPTTMPRAVGMEIGDWEATPTCGEAIGDLPDAEEWESLWFSDEVACRRFGKPSRYASALRCLEPEHWHYGWRREWDPARLTGSLRTEHTAISRQRFAETGEGMIEPVSRFFKLPRQGQSNTLRAGTDSARGAFTSPRPIHYKHPRCITVREMARLHGYPDWFRFHATKWHGARQVGNSVPPPLARAVAGAVLSALGERPVKPTGTLALGDPAVLGLDMTAAAKYWGIPVVIQKRDRKSGKVKSPQIPDHSAAKHTLQAAS